MSSKKQRCYRCNGTSILTTDQIDKWERICSNCSAKWTDLKGQDDIEESIHRFLPASSPPRHQYTTTWTVTHLSSTVGELDSVTVDAKDEDHAREKGFDILSARSPEKMGIDYWALEVKPFL